MAQRGKDYDAESLDDLNDDEVSSVEDFSSDDDELAEDTTEDNNKKSNTSSGLPIKSRKLLLRAIDKRGGIRKCNKQDKVCFEVCERYKSHFGYAKTARRRATENLVYKWRVRAKKGTFHEVRKELGIPKPSNISDTIDDDDDDNSSLQTNQTSQNSSSSARKVIAATITPPRAVTAPATTMSKITSRAKLRMRRPESTFPFTKGLT